jgi:hypothetical protein
VSKDDPNLFDFRIVQVTRGHCDHGFYVLRLAGKLGPAAGAAGGRKSSRFRKIRGKEE